MPGIGQQAGQLMPQTWRFRPLGFGEKDESHQLDDRLK
jgi:hypothetical protein